MSARIISGIIAVIVVALLGLRWPLNQLTPGAVFWIVVGILLAVLTAAWEIFARASKISRTALKKEDLTRYFVDFESHLGTSQYVGSGSHVVPAYFHELLAKASSAKEVFNTLVFFHLSDAMVEEYLRSMKLAAAEEIDGQNDIRMTLVTRVINNKANWHDILSEQVLTATDNSVRQTLDRWKNDTHYEALVLRDAVPAVNMLLFKSQDGTPEVWFGFGLFSGHEIGNVFRSNNPQLCEYFENYWHTLKKASDPYGALKRLDILGEWINVAYNKGGTIRDLAGIRIQLKDHTLAIAGEVYNPDCTHRSGFHAGAVHFGDDGENQGDKFLRYFYRETPIGARPSDVPDYERERVEGSCSYHFKANSRDEFHGVFYDREGEKCMLYGQRVSGPDADAIRTQDTKQIEPVMRKRKNLIRTTQPAGDESAFL